MLIVATLPSTLILYLWAVLVWQWYNRLCLSETCLKCQRRSIVPPNARCVPSYDFSTQKVSVQRKFTNKLLLFVVTLWFPLVSSPKETSRWGKVSTTMMRCKKKSWRGSKGRRQTSMTRGHRSWFQDLNKCLYNAGDYVEK